MLLPRWKLSPLALIEYLHHQFPHRKQGKQELLCAARSERWNQYSADIFRKNRSGFMFAFAVGFGVGFGMVETVDKGVQRLQE